MDRRTIGKMRNKLKNTIWICLVLASLAAAGCETTQWRAKEFGGIPPSWENDIGRPAGYGGETPWR